MVIGNLTIKNATVTGANGVISVEGAGNSLALENCKVEGTSRAINVLNGAEVTIGKGTKVSASGCVVFVNTTEDVKSVLNVEGEITCTDENYAIGGNGSKDNKAIEVNVLPGAKITSLYDSAIFMPVAGSVNVKGGLITGLDGIYLKSGEVNVSDGTIIGKGNAEYKYSGNGSNAMGHGIVVEFTDYPSGLAKLNVTGGTVSSNKKDPIGYVKSPKCTDARTLEELIAANVNVAQ